VKLIGPYKYLKIGSIMKGGLNKIVRNIVATKGDSEYDKVLIPTHS
jgi:hypothetical protein